MFRQEPSHHGEHPKDQTVLIKDHHLTNLLALMRELRGLIMSREALRKAQPLMPAEIRVIQERMVAVMLKYVLEEQRAVCLEEWRRALGAA